MKAKIATQWDSSSLADYDRTFDISNTGEMDRPRSMALSVENKIRAFLRRSGFDCAAVAERSGQTILRIGDFSDEECVAALVRDFYDPRTVAALGDYLEGKMLPQTSVSGEVQGISGFLPDGRILALYCRDTADAVESYRRTKRLWQELMQGLGEGTESS